MKALDAHKTTTEVIVASVPEMVDIQTELFAEIEKRAAEGFYDVQYEFNCSQAVREAVVQQLYDLGYAIKSRFLNGLLFIETPPEVLIIVSWRHPLAALDKAGTVPEPKKAKSKLRKVPDAADEG